MRVAARWSISLIGQTWFVCCGLRSIHTGQLYERATEKWICTGSMNEFYRHGRDAERAFVGHRWLRALATAGWLVQLEGMEMMQKEEQETWVDFDETFVEIRGHGLGGESAGAEQTNDEENESRSACGTSGHGEGGGGGAEQGARHARGDGIGDYDGGGVMMMECGS